MPDQDAFEQTHWELDDLLSAHEGPEFERILADLESAVASIEEWTDRLGPDLSAAAFRDLLGLLKSVRERFYRLGAYGSLWFAADTQSQEALNYRNQIEQLLTDVQNRLLFFSLWWKALDDEPAQRLIVASGDDAYYLETLRRFKPYTLSEAEEKVINVKDLNGVNALHTLYSMITNKFTYKLEVDGEEKELTRAELSTYVQGPRSDLRAAAYQELYRVFGEQSAVLAQIYNHIVRDWSSENVTLRGHVSPIAVRNLANDIPTPVVDTLLQVSRENVDLFQRYFRWKARVLGMDRIRRYDIYAPVSESDKTYPFDQSATLVLDTFERFSSEMASHARCVFTDRHLDSEVRKGKDSGAFCYAVLPTLTPWVLLNYTGKARDVATMAHELGHAVHASLAAESHSILTFHSTLPLAETASVFSEQLLTDRLLEEESDVEVRRDLLVHALDDAYATVTRQAYFVLFERQAHEMIAKGATVDELGAAYMENLSEQFGDAVSLSDEFKWEWISIPHIYRTPFYCYAYSFGQLLVLSLYQRYREQGKSFIPTYLRILAHGGSKSPEFILGEAGIDMASLAFWQGGFDVIGRMIDDLEALG
jgi:oligoendopeptidase F